MDARKLLDAMVGAGSAPPLLARRGLIPNRSRKCWKCSAAVRETSAPPWAACCKMPSAACKMSVRIRVCFSSLPVAAILGLPESAAPTPWKS